VLLQQLSVDISMRNIQLSGSRQIPLPIPCHADFPFKNRAKFRCVRYRDNAAKGLISGNFMTLAG
jgi:hypothetical protein